MLAAMLVGIAVPTGAQTANTLNLYHSDGTPAPLMFGDEAVTVAAFIPGFAGTEARDILPGGARITSSAVGGGQILIDLLETGPSTNLFAGSFKASDDAAKIRQTPTAADRVSMFQTRAGIAGIGTEGAILLGTLTIKADSGAGKQLAVSLPQFSGLGYNVGWVRSQFGEVEAFKTSARLASDLQGTEPINGWGDQVFLKLTDSDLNRNRGVLEYGLVNVWSDSDLVGVQVNLTESTATGVPAIDSSQFWGNIVFESSKNDNQLVFVRPGDHVYMEYRDERNQFGLAQIRHAFKDAATPNPMAFTAMSDGEIMFTGGAASGLFTPDAPGGLRHNMTLLVNDVEKDTGVRSELVTADIHDVTVEPARYICTARLYQLGGTTGQYYATLSFAIATAATAPKAPAGTPPTQACADVGGASMIPLAAPFSESMRSIRATYIDTDNTGASRSLADTITWSPSSTASLTIGAPNGPQRVSGLVQSVPIVLRDSDADLNPTQVDQAFVRVRSDSKPSDGVLVALSEQTANAGVFTGQITFTKSVSSTTSLLIKDGDFVQATYEDPSGANGRATRMQSNKLVWREPTTAVITLDDTQYFYSRVSTNLDPARPDTYARILVNDTDQNDPRIQDHIRVNAVPENPPGAQSASFVLDEIGIDSGIFVGYLMFTDAKNSFGLPTDQNPTRLYVGDRVNGVRFFHIEFADSAMTSGAAGVAQSPTVQFRQITQDNVRVVRFERLETQQINDQYSLQRYARIDNLAIQAYSSSAGPGGRPNPVIVAVYAKAGIPPPVVEMHSNLCPEDTSFTVEDTDSEDALGRARDETMALHAGGGAGDGRYARIVNIASSDPGESCDATAWVDPPLSDVSVGAQPGDSSTVTARTAQIQYTMTTPVLANPQTVLKSVDGRTLGPGQFVTGTERAVYVDTAARNDAVRKDARDIVYVDVQTMTDAYPRGMALVETGLDTRRFMGSLLPREQEDLRNDPAAVQSRMTTGSILSDTVPGPQGDRCGGAETGTAAAATCFQLMRTMPDGSISNFAVGGPASTTNSVVLTKGLRLGPVGEGGRCAPTAVEIQAPAVAPFTCGEILVSGKRYAFGEATPAILGDTTGVSLTNTKLIHEVGATPEARVPFLRLTDGVSSGAGPSRFGDTCSVNTVNIRTGMTLTREDSAKITCMEFTRYAFDGTKMTTAVTITDTVFVNDGAGAGPASLAAGRPSEPSPPTVADPAFFTLTKGFMAGAPGASASCDGSSDAGAIGGSNTYAQQFRLPLEETSIVIPGGFGCAEFSFDPPNGVLCVTPNGQAVACQPTNFCEPDENFVTLDPLGDDDPVQTEPCTPLGADNEAELEGVLDGLVRTALGEPLQATLTLHPSGRNVDYIEPGQMANTCSEDGFMRLPGVDGDYETPGCVQVSLARQDGQGFTMAFDFVTGTTVRFASGFLQGNEGLGGSCEPTAVMATLVMGATITGLNAVENLTQSPTCIDMVIPSGIYAGKYALGWERRDPTVALVRSDLQRATSAESRDFERLGINPEVTRNMDGIRVTGRSSGTDTPASTAWFDTRTAKVEIANDPAGVGGSVEIRLTGDDLLSGRVYGERLSTTSITVRTFETAQRFIPGSEVVYMQSSEEDAEPGRHAVQIPILQGTVVFDWEVSVATEDLNGAKSGSGSPAEPIMDFDKDGRVGCGDVDVFSRGQPAGTTDACRRAVGDGWIQYGCGTTSSSTQCRQGVSLDYWSRLAYVPVPTTFYEYARPDDKHVRLGDTICKDSDPTGEVSIDCSDPTGEGVVDFSEGFLIDYTPAIQFVMLTSSAGEEERVAVQWDSAMQNADGSVGGYRGQIPVETFRVPNDGAIYVNGNSAILTARFDDPYNVGGVAAKPGNSDFRAVTSTAIWRKGADAVLSFHTPDFTGVRSAVAYGSALPIQVTDGDADRTGQEDHVVVTAANAGNPEAGLVQVVLRETGLRTGIFRGNLGLSTIVEPDTLLLPASDAKIAVRYEDTASNSGLRSAIVGFIDWLPAGSGSIGLFTDVARQMPTSPTNVPVGADGSLFVTIVDPDANINPSNVDKINAIVYSDGEREGEPIVLTERAGNAGTFDSSAIKFESLKTLKNGKVFAREATQDQVWVEYFDITSGLGGAKNVASAFTKWDATDDGEVSFDFPSYIGTPADVAAGHAGIRAFGLVSVADSDCNLNPSAIDIIDAAATCGTSTANAISRFCLVNGNTATTCSATGRGPVRLIETFANSGEFVGNFTFGATTDPAVEPMVLGVANGAMLRAIWSDARSTAGLAPHTFTKDADWHARGYGVVNFDATAYTDIAEPVVVTLVDSHLASLSTGTPKTQDIQIKSDAIAAPLTITLTETGKHTGIFRKTLTLSETTSGGSTIKVNKQDTLTLTYVDAEPAGTRTGTSIVNFLDKTAPVTTLVVAGAAKGARDVYLDKVTVGFTVQDESPIRRTEYRFGEATAFTEFIAGDVITLDEGSHKITYRSVDVLGHEEGLKEFVVEVDKQDPIQVPAGLMAKQIAGGDLRINWTSVPDVLNQSNFFEYVVFRDGNTVPIGNTTTNEFIDTNLTDELPHSYRVSVADKAGRLGPLSLSVTGAADASVPSLGGATVSPNRWDVRNKPADGVQVAVGATDNALVEVRADLVLPSGESVSNVILGAGINGTRNGTLDVSDFNQPCACNVMFSALDEAGNLGRLNVSVIVDGPDSLAPDAVIEAADGLLPLGRALNVTVSDNIALTRVSYALDSGATVAVDVPTGQAVVKFQVPAAILALGPHALRIEAADNATTLEGDLLPNNLTKTLNFTVVVGPEGISEPSFFLVTRARQLANGTMLVEWDVPAELAGVAGFQVWRSSSPFELIETLNDAGRRSFHDSSVQTGKTYRYAVSFFTAEPFENIAQVPGYPGSDDGVPASAGVEAKSPQGVLGQGWLWWVLGALALVAIAALIAVAIARRGNTQQQTVMQPAPAAPTEVEATTQEPASVATDLHRLRCPECSHRFEVNGTRPIVTNCPNCGRKGILR